MLAIRKALIARGADVCVATHGGTHERLLQELGVPYEIVGPAMSDQRSREFVRNGAGLGPPNQSMWTDDELRAYVMAEAAFFRERAVRVAVTGFTLTALLSTRLAGIPLACEHAGSFVPPVWERKLIEPQLSMPIPGAGRLPYKARRWFANLGVNHVKMHCRGFNRIAKELGIEGVPSFAQLLLGDLTIVPEIPEVLGISKQELESWRPTGKGYRESTRLRSGGPIFAELDLPIPDRVERFLDGGGPVVYVALTSTTADQVRAVVGGLRVAPVRVLVAGTVHELSDLDGDNVLVAGTLPSHLVMPRVDLAVTTGGQGSVQCAMAAGTPLIALPLHPEQDFNGQLIERQGAGRRMTFRDAASPRLAAAALEILGDPRYRAEAQRLAVAYSQVDGPALAAEAILELVGVRS